ncbi:hypothetical protein A1343_05755 [Leptospira interrogans serovar Bataviae]|nr:hypothetical protein [Leptospira interrogans serovar Bataviae]OAM75974.1 hypothetical protein A1343_05755 [Leptospira interrogans serovar Bataviae]
MFWPILKCRKSRICGIFKYRYFFANSVVNNLVLFSYALGIITFLRKSAIKAVLFNLKHDYKMIRIFSKTKKRIVSILPFFAI